MYLTWKETTHHKLVVFLPILVLEVGINDLNSGTNSIPVLFLAMFRLYWITWRHFHNHSFLVFILCCESKSVWFIVLFYSPHFVLIIHAFGKYLLFIKPLSHVEFSIICICLLPRYEGHFGAMGLFLWAHRFFPVTWNIRFWHWCGNFPGLESEAPFLVPFVVPLQSHLFPCFV